MRSRTTNSVRSHTAMMKAAEGKSELEIPKGREAEIHASILGTRQAFDALERAIWENEKLKLSHAQESERVKQRLAYFEQNYEAASKARMDEIKKMIIKSQELDLAFLVDATGSMQVLPSNTSQCSVPVEIEHLILSTQVTVLKKYVLKVLE